MARTDTPAPAPQTPLRVGPYEIDRHARRLCHEGQTVALGSRGFDLLLALVDGRQAAQPAAALLAAVWPDRRVGENNLRVQMSHLRRLLGEGAISHRVGHGYQLLLPVQAEAAPEPAGSPGPGNLPEALWPLMGRDELLPALAARLQPGCRVTLLAPGGAGKTALALAVAQQVAPAFADGVWWVDLAPLRDPAQVAGAVAQALGLPPARKSALEALASALADRPQALLLLDNAEHLVSAVNALCDALLRAAPRVAVLATSRVAIGHAGEALQPVPALSLPPPGAADALAAARSSGAVRLLESRARAIDPRFRLTADNAAALLEICQRLDGHALSLTLAAARLPLLGVQGLRESLDERLRWTQPAVPGSAAPQHLSLQGALDWSHALLPEAQRQLLRRLGAFRGPFALREVQAVAAAGTPPLGAAAAARALESLVAQGLVNMDGGALLQARGDAARHTLYTLHETTRLYAAGLLQASGEADAVRAALAQHVCESQQLSDASEQAADRAQAHRMLLDVEHLVEWATSRDAALAASLVEVALRAWRRIGQHSLALRLATPLLDTPHTPLPPARQVALQLQLCLIDFEMDDYAALMARCDVTEALLAQWPDPCQHGVMLSWRGNVMGMQGDLPAAEALYRAAVEQHRRAGGPQRLRESLGNLGWAVQAAGRHDEARPLLQEVLALNIEAGDEWGRMVTHENLAELEMAARQPLAAGPHLEALAALARRHPDLYRLCHACTYIALCGAQTGEWQHALAAAQEALRLAEQLGAVRLHSGACLALGLVLQHGGDVRRARSLQLMARRLLAPTGVALTPHLAAADEAITRRSQEALSAAERRAAEIEGELLTLAEARAWAAAAERPAPALSRPPSDPGRRAAHPPAG